MTFGRISSLFLATLAATTLVACDKLNESKRTRFDGVPFVVSAKVVDKKVTRAVFDVTVKEAARSYTGARLAAAHEGTRYCIENYGTSVITWQNDPYDEGADLVIAGGNAVFRGTCSS